MLLKPEEQIQSKLNQLFQYSRNGIYLDSGEYYKLVDKDSQFISNRNESGKNGRQGQRIGKIFNMMGRLKGEPDIMILYPSNYKTPTLCYVEVKTPKRYKQKNKGLEDSQIQFRDNVCKNLNVPWKCVCDEYMFFEFLAEVGIVNCVDK